MREEEKYELAIPRAIATGIILEAAEIFGLEVDQEKGGRENAFGIEGEELPKGDYVPRVVLRGESKETLLEARDYIYKKHEEWIGSLEERRKMRNEQIMKKMRK